MSRHRLIALAAAVAVTGGGAAAATAATKHEGPAAQFQKRLAGELGVSPGTLRAATQASGLATVRSLEANGKLGADRAARLEKAIEAGRAVPLTQLGEAHRRGSGVKPLAKAIGATPKAVRTALQGGATPAKVIADAGKEPAAVKQTIQAAIRMRLQQGVAAGRLTSAQADQRAEKRATRLTAAAPLTHHAG